jgi:hypothetical protein
MHILLRKWYYNTVFPEKRINRHDEIGHYGILLRNRRLCNRKGGARQNQECSKADQAKYPPENRRGQTVYGFVMVAVTHSYRFGHKRQKYTIFPFSGTAPVVFLP